MRRASRSASESEFRTAATKLTDTLLPVRMDITTTTHMLVLPTGIMGQTGSLTASSLAQVRGTAGMAAGAAGTEDAGGTEDAAGTADVGRTGAASKDETTAAAKASVVAGTSAPLLASVVTADPAAIPLEASMVAVA
jgi:hypothetical protein